MPGCGKICRSPAARREAAKHECDGCVSHLGLLPSVDPAGLRSFKPSGPPCRVDTDVRFSDTMRCVCRNMAWRKPCGSRVSRGSSLRPVCATLFKMLRTSYLRDGPRSARRRVRRSTIHNCRPEPCSDQEPRRGKPWTRAAFTVARPQLVPRLLTRPLHNAFALGRLAWPAQLLKPRLKPTSSLVHGNRQWAR